MQPPSAFRAARLFAASALLLLLTAAAAVLAAGMPTLENHWEGAIELPGQYLEVKLNFSHEDRTWIGDISIPAQGARNLALEKITVAGRDVSFAITGVPGEPTFKGELSEDGASISGTFTQGGQTFPFHLESGAPETDKAAAALSGIQEIVDAALEDWKAPGLGLAVVADGKIVLARGFGLRDVERNLPVTADTLFAIGSSTKAFTTLLLGQLVDEGKLSWDEPVASYLPGFKLHDEYATAHLTARDMLSHRSGLPRHDLVWYNNQTIGRAELVRRLRFLPPNKELREAWQYNNLMFLTAGFLAEKLTGETWEEAVRERIFEPLGMARSNFSVEESQKDPDHALPYQEDDDELHRVDFRPIQVMGPAGSINSSPSEMARWVQLHLGRGRFEGRAIIHGATLEELHSPQMAIPGLPDEPESSPAAYAFGWFVAMHRGHLFIHHGGNIDGFTALVSLFPMDGIGVVALVNKSGSALPALVTKTVADRILGLPEKNWIAEAAAKRDKAKEFTKKGEEKKALFRVRGTSPSRKLAEFAGKYGDPGYGQAEILLESDSLVLVYNGMRMPLEHWHYDVFNVAEMKDEIVPEDLRVSFRTDERGRVAGFDAPFEPFVDPIFFSRMPDGRLSDPAFLSRLTGDYELPGQTINVSLKGTVLVVQASGQPALELVPSGADEFNIKGLSGFSVRFKVAEPGPASAVIVIEPSGVFEAARAKAEGEK